MSVVQPPGIPSRYQVTAKLGSGGMGVVYKARDTSLEKDVAIKMLLIPNLEPSVLARFHREAKLASSLKHGNLITVLDFGVTDDGNPFMVMDFANGESLAAKIEREGTPPLEQSLEIFVQICQGLSHAHNKGIIHRDLKPGNVILTTSDTGALIVKVLDFGLAKPADAINESTLTDLVRLSEARFT